MRACVAEMRVVHHSKCSTFPLPRARRLSQHLQGPTASSILPIGGTAPTVIRVVASAPGLASGSVDIPLSTRVEDAPLAVAAASVALADVSP